MPVTFSMAKAARVVFCGLSVVVLLAGCRSAPLTGRKQFMLMTEDKEVALGATAFQETVAKEPLSKNQAQVEMVQRVGQRIAAVSGRTDYQWEFKLIASPQQNAFCLPGGKVAVHEGILPICESESGLAVVMSHEIAHAIARHGGERISQSYAVEAAKQAMAYATQSQDAQRKEMIMKAYGAASQYGVILPYSRKHESEADHIGLMLMAKAGYDPAEAPRFWQRFGAATSGQAPMEFFSTHPSDATRTSNLLALLPEAQKLYADSPQKYGRGEMIVVAAPKGGDTPAASTGSTPLAAPSLAIPFGGSALAAPPLLPATAVAAGGASALATAPASAVPPTGETPTVEPPTGDTPAVAPPTIAPVTNVE